MNNLSNTLGVTGKLALRTDSLENFSSGDISINPNSTSSGTITVPSNDVFKTDTINPTTVGGTTTISNLTATTLTLPSTIKVDTINEKATNGELKIETTGTNSVNIKSGSGTTKLQEKINIYDHTLTNKYINVEYSDLYDCGYINMYDSLHGIIVSGGSSLANAPFLSLYSVPTLTANLLCDDFTIKNNTSTVFYGKFDSTGLHTDTISEYTTNAQLVINTIGTNNVKIENFTVKDNVLDNVNDCSITTSGTTKNISITPTGSCIISRPNFATIVAGTMISGGILGIDSSNAVIKTNTLIDNYVISNASASSQILLELATPSMASLSSNTLKISGGAAGSYMTISKICHNTATSSYTQIVDNASTLQLSNTGLLYNLGYSGSGETVFIEKNIGNGEYIDTIIRRNADLTRKAIIRHQNHVSDPYYNYIGLGVNSNVDCFIARSDGSCNISPSSLDCTLTLATTKTFKISANNDATQDLCTMYNPSSTTSGKNLSLKIGYNNNNSAEVRYSHTNSADTRGAHFKMTYYDNSGMFIDDNGATFIKSENNNISIGKSTSAGAITVKPVISDGNCGYYGGSSTTCARIILYGSTSSAKPSESYYLADRVDFLSKSGVDSISCYASAFVSTSTRRIKENIIPIPKIDYEKVYQMQPVQYNLKEKKRCLDYGLIAEDLDTLGVVQAIEYDAYWQNGNIKEPVRVEYSPIGVKYIYQDKTFETYTNDQVDETDSTLIWEPHGIDYKSIIPMLIGCIKDLKQKNNDLTLEHNNLVGFYNNLLTRVQQIETLIKPATI